METEENRFQNVRIYQKRPRKNSNVQLRKKESEKYQTTQSNKTDNTDSNHQPDILSSSSDQFEKNYINLSSIEMTIMKNSTTRTVNPQAKQMNVPVISNRDDNNNEVFKNLSSNSSSHTQMQQPSKWKCKTVLKNLVFVLFLVLFITALIAIPIVTINYMSSIEQNTVTDPCKSSRTLTFDDIGANPLWNEASGYGGMLPGYGGFIWTWTNYINVSNNMAFGTSLVSGGYVAYIDNTTPSNKVKISTNNSALFYICSMVVTSIGISQTPFTVWGTYSNTIAYIMNVTINSTTSSTLDFSTWKIGVDTIEMFAYGNIFAFDNLVVSGP